MNNCQKPFHQQFHDQKNQKISHITIYLLETVIYLQKNINFFLKIEKDKMTQRRPWTQQQDKILKYLRQQQKIKKWSQISKLMELNYQIQGRNQKQCRQRYQNHLNSNIITEKLSDQQEKMLFQLHDQHGNKWSVIANHFYGRTDNTLKNHFHSKLRGAIRKINRYLGCKKKRSSKSYPLSIVYKIVKYFGQNKNDFADLSQFNIIKLLKNTLLKFSGANIQYQQSDPGQKNQKKLAQKILYLLQIFQKINKSFPQQYYEKQLILDNQDISINNENNDRDNIELLEDQEENYKNHQNNKQIKTNDMLPDSTNIYYGGDGQKIYNMNDGNKNRLFRTFSQNQDGGTEGRYQNNRVRERLQNSTNPKQSYYNRIQAPIPKRSNVLITDPSLLYKLPSSINKISIQQSQPQLQFQKIQLNKQKSSKSYESMDNDIKKLVQEKSISSMAMNQYSQKNRKSLTQLTQNPQNPGMQKMTSFGSYSMEMIDENSLRRNQSLLSRGSNIWTKDLEAQDKLDSYIFQ